MKQNSENIAPSSSKRKTKGENATTGKKSRRTMSFGGGRMKPDSLQLSVVGYDDNDDTIVVESRSHADNKMDMDDHEAFEMVGV